MTLRFLLDEDECFLGLANTNEERRKRYRRIVLDGASVSEQQTIRNALARNQLTGNQRFTEEIEMRIGLRVELRGPGRPKVEAKKVK